MKNIVYVFTGTGNSLYVAKRIADEIGDCKVVGINKNTTLKIEEGLERVGIVFPCYAGGLPVMVNEFLKDLKNFKQQNTYFYAITTMGGNGGGAIPMFNKAIEGSGWKLNYGEKVLAFPNFIVGYPMIRGVKFFDKRTKKGINNIVAKITNKETNEVKEIGKSIEKNYDKFMIKFQDTDSYYNINEKCIGCNVCVEICPSKNITLNNNKPEFNNQCEKCVACIQACPQEAINYKDKTQKRRRYINPNITVEEIIKCNNS